MALDGKLNPSFYSKSSKLLQANGEMIIVKKEDWLQRGIETENGEKGGGEGLKEEAARNGAKDMGIGDIGAEEIAQAEFSLKLHIITA